MTNPAPTGYRAIQGFVCYLCSLVLFAFYMFWALAPLEWLGLDYFPDKYLALSLSNVSSVVLVMILYVFYPAINLALTPDVDAIATVVDVKLLQGGDKTKLAHDDWAAIQRLEIDQRNRSRITVMSNNVEERCNFCTDVHHHNLNVDNNITTLYHLDLAEINRLFYD
ncbi:phosphatidylinositol N-acetylglucosaminyltransferase subunit P [Ceratitis capitata]|uniref:Phosphatidylinositol N-acetylglucosaminyltransferase subunit P n=1 Tax=Ceratitis capitata TaxID=7213 RepID=W8BBB0_CERCA|nr:phosphatidylinositol N-acetylglucosaminyltransferase subunit P [Ceratitis capitata]